MTFVSTNKPPGVFIDEIQLPGPIAGVGTSTPAFLGPAKAGPINTPIFLTNWTQFSQTFGLLNADNQFDPYMINPDVFAAHAVRGFFDNQGAICYFVRVSKAAPAFLDLNDSSPSPGRPTLVVTAVQEGVGGDAITVEVKAAHVATTKLSRPSAALTASPSGTPANQATVTSAADAARFSPGDLVVLNQSSSVNEKATVRSIAATGKASAALTTSPSGSPATLVTLANAADAASFAVGDSVVLTQAAKTESATIATIAGAAITFGAALANTYTGGTMQRARATITFAANLANTYTSGTITPADPVPGQTRVRVDDTTGIEPGSYVSLSQGSGGSLVTETLVVGAVEKITKALTFSTPLKNAYPAGGGNVGVVTQEFTLVVSNSVTVPNLSMDPRHSRYVLNVLKSPDVASGLSIRVSLPPVPNPTPPPKNLPAVLAATNLANGADENLAGINAIDYHAALDALARVDDVTMVCVPDAADDPITQNAVVAHCERMQDRFAILDPASTAVVLPAPGTTQTSILIQLQGDGTPNNPGLASTRGYAALYFPRVVISHPVIPNQKLTIPPSGHLAGLFARTDNNRGVWKAPANDVLANVLAVEQVLSDDEQGPLNEQNVNVIRFFKGRGVVVWGARTTSPSGQWRYVSSRRFMIFAEKSVQRATQFAVFEPNEPALWQTIKREVNEFLNGLWHQGALFGVTASQAFRVKVDAELNPPEVRALGQLVIEVVVVLAFPAEYVVFRVIQDPTGATLSEK
jgi:phage tail sheath protein FI